MVREFVKKHMCSITTFALTLVAAGMASKCCYFMFYQPEVPENLKKFSKQTKALWKNYFKKSQ